MTACTARPAAAGIVGGFPASKREARSSTKAVRESTA